MSTNKPSIGSVVLEIAPFRQQGKIFQPLSQSFEIQICIAVFGFSIKNAFK